jgi:L,D-transpeptidase ErfK/SrfK
MLNLAEMRLYYYRAAAQPGTREVVTYPIGIGRQSWETPTLTTAVAEKRVRPSWFVPESIRTEYLAKGKQLPAVVKPGPDNPLGEYALRLGDTSYLIHGTNRPGGIGMRVSHGCIRLYPEDIESLFAQVEVGTQVRIVDEPAKAGFFDGQLYLEAHTPYTDDSLTQDQVLASATEVIAQAALGRTVSVNWERVRKVVREANGIPTAIGAIRSLDPGNSWMLVAGSFAAESKARSLAASIGAARLDSRTWKIDDRYQVEVGPFADVQQADYARKLIRQRTGILALKIPPG